jgi:hypothetical protein
METSPKLKNKRKTERRKEIERLIQEWKRNHGYEISE